MTEIDLLKSQFPDGYGCRVVKVNDLEEFLKEHVCIKKGENRHPYADVMHEWIEGADMQEKLTNWHNTLSCKEVYGTKELRIKPPEPQHKWQWIQFRTDRAYVSYGFYETIHELYSKEISFWNACTTYKLEETKRERK